MRLYLDFLVRLFKNSIYRSVRQISTFILILVLLPLEVYAGVAELYKANEYKSVVAELSAQPKLDYKQHIYLITSYKKMNKLDEQIMSLRKASLQFPEKDVFFRELAAALETKSNSYIDNTNFKKIKTKFKHESIEVLSDLYKRSPTPANLTAIINYYNREKDYGEVIGILEVYGRKNPRGKIYYSYLCEAQFRAEFYNASAKTCKIFADKFPSNVLAQLLYAKSIDKAGTASVDIGQKFSKLASRFPASSEIQFETGKKLITKGDSKKGLEYLEKHLALKTTDEALVLKAETLFEMADYEKALEVFVQACKQHKEPRKPLFRRIINSRRKLASLGSNDKELIKKYDNELRKCKHAYRPKRKSPKGILGGGYGSR